MCSTSQPVAPELRLTESPGDELLGGNHCGVVCANRELARTVRG